MLTDENLNTLSLAPVPSAGATGQAEITEKDPGEIANQMHFTLAKTCGLAGQTGQAR